MVVDMVMVVVGWRHQLLAVWVSLQGSPGGSEVKPSACNAVRSLGREDPLEEGMATRSSILAWTIPWTEEPGRLYSP